MSLDVWIVRPRKCPKCGTLAGTEEVLWTWNITHNLTGMAEHANLYQAMWRPDELFEHPKCNDLLPMLESGLESLLGNPEEFKQYNPFNGWGRYEGLVQYCRMYVAACHRFPDDFVKVFR